MIHLSDSKDDRLLIVNFLTLDFKQVFDAFRKEEAFHDVLAIGLRAVRDGTTPSAIGSHDPFSDGEYKVITHGSTWKVYSFGVNRRDDRGTVEPTTDPKAHNDIVFSWDGKEAKVAGR